MSKLILFSLGFMCGILFSEYYPKDDGNNKKSSAKKNNKKIEIVIDNSGNNTYSDYLPYDMV